MIRGTWELGSQSILIRTLDIDNPLESCQLTWSYSACATATPAADMHVCTLKYVIMCNSQGFNLHFRTVYSVNHEVDIVRLLNHSVRHVQKPD